MANHLTPVEIAYQRGLEPQEVVASCIRFGVPILNGRIDKTLFALAVENGADPARQGRTN